jgi:roadblock/LC7 domain-containing protein
MGDEQLEDAERQSSGEYSPHGKYHVKDTGIEREMAEMDAVLHEAIC